MYPNCTSKVLLVPILRVSYVSLMQCMSSLIPSVAVTIEATSAEGDWLHLYGEEHSPMLCKLELKLETLFFGDCIRNERILFVIAYDNW